jgi:hypothetical protein
MWCGICQHYANGKRTMEDFVPAEEGKDITSKKDRAIDDGLRTCKQVGKKVKYKQDSCPLFQLQKIFFCPRHSQQLDIVVCIARKNKRFEGCTKCKPGNKIKTYQERTIS